MFTGILPVPREQVKRLVTRAGATVQSSVDGQTTLIVAGDPNALMIGRRAGTKMLDARRRMQRGQKIAILGYEQLEPLLTA